MYCFNCTCIVLTYRTTQTQLHIHRTLFIQLFTPRGMSACAHARTHLQETVTAIRSGPLVTVQDYVDITYYLPWRLLSLTLTLLGLMGIPRNRRAHRYLKCLLLRCVKGILKVISFRCTFAVEVSCLGQVMKLKYLGVGIALDRSVCFKCMILFGAK